MGDRECAAPVGVIGCLNPGCYHQRGEANRCSGCCSGERRCCSGKL